jgi:hypothetical protein
LISAFSSFKSILCSPHRAKRWGAMKEIYSYRSALLGSEST